MNITHAALTCQIITLTRTVFAVELLQLKSRQQGSGLGSGINGYHACCPVLPITHLDKDMNSERQALVVLPRCLATSLRCREIGKNTLLVPQSHQGYPLWFFKTIEAASHGLLYHSSFSVKSLFLAMDQEILKTRKIVVSL